MIQNPNTIDLTRFDVRDIPCRIKHAQIFQRWTELPVGQCFVLVNDHDPVPLYYQFAAQFPGAFNWEYLVEGPDEFQVRITRLAETTTGRIAPPPRPAAPAVIVPLTECTVVDARGLEPPEPMLRILTAVENLSATGRIRAITDRRPVHLLPELTQRGFTHQTAEQADGTWQTLIERR